MEFRPRLSGKQGDFRCFQDCRRAFLGVSFKYVLVKVLWRFVGFNMQVLLVHASSLNPRPKSCSLLGFLARILHFLYNIGSVRDMGSEGYSGDGRHVYRLF